MYKTDSWKPGYIETQSTDLFGKQKQMIWNAHYLQQPEFQLEEGGLFQSPRSLNDMMNIPLETPGSIMDIHSFW